MQADGEIFVLPFFTSSHVYPCTELCRLLCSMQYKTTLIISSELLTLGVIPSYLLDHRLFRVAECPAPLPPPPSKWAKSGPDHLQIYFQQLGEFIESLLGSRASAPDPKPRAFAVVDSMMMGWSKGVFKKLGLPVVALFTCGAASIALEHAAWVADVENLKPGETRILPCLPEHMAFGYSDLAVRRNGVGSGHGSVQPGRKKKSFPTEPGDEPPWVEETEGAVAFLINTCEELERPFVDYVASQVGLPVWAVGPLLPQQNQTKTVSELEKTNVRCSNYSTNQILEWLNSKPNRSVIYISFGTFIIPELDELEEIAKALEETGSPFIWVLQADGSEVLSEYYPHGLDKKVGDQGLIIHGWAPQLLILNHPSTGGFLTHCGWSSTLEAIGYGVPSLAWPINGDQFYNAKAIESHFKVGFAISKSPRLITKDVILRGIEKLMSDEEVRRRAEALRDEAFKDGFPASSVASLNAFKGFISHISTK